MYRPDIKRKQSKAPVLSRKEIDIIGENKTVIPLSETATMKSGPKSSNQVSDQVGNDAVVKKILEFCKTART